LEFRRSIFLVLLFACLASATTDLYLHECLVPRYADVGLGWT
jgi:hypothetical protein